MLIIGCDYHPSVQQIAFVDTDTGELSERRLGHREQAEQFYQELKQRNLAVRVGMESSGHSRWFERLLRELGFELWIGDPGCYANWLRVPSFRMADHSLRITAP